MHAADPAVTVQDVVGVEHLQDAYFAGDDVAALFRLSCPSLITMVWLVLGDRGAAEEVVQDAFISLQRAWPTMRDRSRAVGYLRATALNLSRSRLRHRRVVLRRPLAPPAEVASAEESAMVTEDRRRVLAALAGLPVRQRECLVLKYYTEMTEQEISAALKISANSVKTHLRRGRAALGAILEDGT